MIRQEFLAAAPVPGTASELRLYRHDRDYTIRIGTDELMTSRTHGSEELLAELALAGLGDCSSPRVLIGGLGMGFTLAAVLRLVGGQASVEVVELVPQVVDWNDRWFGALNGHPLGDPRVTATAGDVGPRIRSARARFDAVLLDVDNGPEGLTRAGNGRLYDRSGLAAARTALRPNGVLAIWSASDHPWFTRRLRDAGFNVRVERVRARRTRGARHTVWVATA